MVIPASWITVGLLQVSSIENQLHKLCFGEENQLFESLWEYQHVFQKFSNIAMGILRYYIKYINTHMNGVTALNKRFNKMVLFTMLDAIETNL